MAEGQLTQREFVFSKRDFDEVRKLIYDHAGIALTEAKEDMVYRFLPRGAPLPYPQGLPQDPQGPSHHHLEFGSQHRRGALLHRHDGSGGLRRQQCAGQGPGQ